MENQHENNHSDKPPTPEPPIYFGTGGKPLFGTIKPSGFSYAHPWPPTATNLNKKQVIRPGPDEDEDSPFLRRSSSVDGKELFKPLPKSSSDIELALYWDRAPYWNLNLPKTMMCPVHGQVPPFKAPIERKLTSRPSTSISSQMEQSKNNAASYKLDVRKKKPQLMEPQMTGQYSDGVSPKKNHHRRSVSASTAEAKSKTPSTGGSSTSERERNREKNMVSEHFVDRDGEKSSEKIRSESMHNEYSRGNEITHDNAHFEEGINPIPPLSSENNQNGHHEEYLQSESIKKYPHSANAFEKNVVENSTVASQSHKDSKEEAEETSSSFRDVRSAVKCSSMTQPPMIVRSISSLSNKSVQVADNELSKTLSRATTNLCPLHGSYWRGIQRRNTPRFRTVLKKDTEVQADLQITSCCNTRRRNPPSDFVRKSVGNLFSERNLNRFPKSAKKCEGLSEYGENYKDPIIVAESKKRNRSVATCSISNRTFHKHNNVM